MPIFPGTQNADITGVFTDVGGDYNNPGVTWNPNISMEGSSGGRGGDSASNVTVNLGRQYGQEGLDPPVHCFLTKTHGS